MAFDINLLGLLQVDATVITGVLILLTITKLARSVDENLPVLVTWIIVPFGISAVLTLLAMVFVETTLHLGIAAIIGMILGFVYLMVAILDLSKKKK